MPLLRQVLIHVKFVGKAEQSGYIFYIKQIHFKDNDRSSYRGNESRIKETGNNANQPRA